MEHRFAGGAGPLYFLVKDNFDRISNPVVLVLKPRKPVAQNIYFSCDKSFYDYGETVRCSVAMTTPDILFGCDNVSATGGCIGNWVSLMNREGWEGQGTSNWRYTMVHNLPNGVGPLYFLVKDGSGNLSNVTAFSLRPR